MSMSFGLMRNDMSWRRVFLVIDLVCVKYLMGLVMG